jgi:hypothetical protein
MIDEGEVMLLSADGFDDILDEVLNVLGKNADRFFLEQGLNPSIPIAILARVIGRIFAPYHDEVFSAEALRTVLIANVNLGIADMILMNAAEPSKMN